MANRVVSDVKGYSFEPHRGLNFKSHELFKRGDTFTFFTQSEGMAEFKVTYVREFKDDPALVYFGLDQPKVVFDVTSILIKGEQ